MDYMRLGSLRSNLMVKKHNPNDRFGNLYYISKALNSLHRCNLVHGNFHSGNILMCNHLFAHISDFGLTRAVDQTTAESNEVFGVLPYIAPEVLRGYTYTTAADIYSLGIIMWEMMHGVTAFNDVPHDFNLSLNICKGLRPKVEYSDEHPEYVMLMMRCWNSDPAIRPTAEELTEYFRKLRDKYKINWYRYKRVTVVTVPSKSKDHDPAT